ncbi:MAG: alpha/beta fold hydrolase [Salibacteraceae bacterium]
MIYLLIVLITLIVVFIAILIVLYSRQEKMIFLGDKLEKTHIFNFPGEYEERFYNPEEGVSIHGLLFRVPDSKGIVFYFHGHMGSIASWGQWASMFQDKGWDVFIGDYRGYGKSTGVIEHEHSIHKDAQYIYDRIIPEYKDKRVILYGRSLGTGIASNLALAVNPEKLILSTPYYNFEEVVSHHYPLLPISLLLKYKFRNDLCLAKLKIPIYLFHGTEDDYVPYESSVKLAKIGSHIDFTSIPGATHSDFAGFPEFLNKMSELLE